MPDVTANSHQPPEDRFLEWVDALVDPIEEMPVPDTDLAELADTAAFVQRTAGVGSAPSLSTDRTESMWEEIMHTAPTAVTFAPTLPASNGERPIPSGALLTAQPTGWRTWLPTALLIAAIGVAGFAAAWRIAGPFDLSPGGSGPETAHQPGIAASATPAASADGCPLTNDMPIFPAGAPDGASDLGTTYAVVEDGNLTIRCSGVDDPEPMMTGITNAMPLQWPGTVLLALEGGDAIAYDIVSGERSELGPDAMWGGTWTSPGSPWLLTPNNDAYIDWRITNLETMKTMTLSDEIGGVLPSDFVPDVAWSPNTDVAVITQKSEFGQGNPVGTPEATIAELPGTGLVIDETLETRRWIDVQGQVTVGDGVIAYETRSDGQPVLVVEDAKGGETLLRLFDIDFDSAAGSSFAFAGERDFVYIYEGVAHVATHQGGQAWSFMPIRQVGTGERRAVAIYPTGVPGRVLIEWNNEDNIGGPSEPGAKSVSILDVTTGKLTDVDGLVPIDPDLPARFVNARKLVAVDPTSGADDMVVARMIDITSGNPVMTSEPIDASVRELIEANNAFGSSLTGDVVTISPPDGTPVLLNATTGTASPVSTDALPDSSDQGDLIWHVTPSSDGTLLFAIGRPQPEGNSGLDITSPNALPGMFAVAPLSNPEWSEPVDPLPAGAILGVPAGDSNDDPAVMEAQEFATPTGSPDATAASADGCQLTNDMLIFVGEAPTLQIEGVGPSLAVVEPDGDFVITCGGVDDPARLMTGIANATALQWPGTVLLERDDGSAVVVNVATGQQAEIGDATLAQAGWAVQQFSMPWLVTPSNASATDWRFTNLKTMASFTLSDELGGLLEEGRVPTIQTPHDSSVAVISFDWTLGTNARLSPELAVEPPPDPETATLVDVPTGSLVVDSTIQRRRWIDTTGSIAVSPDGLTIAYQTPGESGQVLRIEDAATGDLRAELTGSNFVGTPAEEFAFDGDGDALVYLDGNSVWIATWDGGLSTTQVETGDMRPSAVQTIDAPDRVVLVRFGDQAGPRTALTGNRALSVLDTATATVTKVDGLVADNNLQSTSQFVARADHLVTATTLPDSPDQVILHLVDVATGEVLLTSGPIPDTALTDASTATYSGDGSIAVINLDGTTALYFNANTSTVEPISVEPLPSTDQFASVRWIIAPSHDGLYFYAFGEPAVATPTATSGRIQYFSVALLSSDPNWPPPISTIPTGAILGVPAGDTNDDPAVMEAQEFATPAPASTDASSAAKHPVATSTPASR